MNRKSAPLAVLLALSLFAAGCSRDSSADMLASGKALLEKKDPKGAVIQFKNVLQKEANNGQARYYLGKALLENGEPASAVVELRKAQELQVPDETVLPELARAMLQAGEGGRLVTQYGAQSLKDPAALADFKTSLATAYALQRETDRSRAAAEEALQARPGYAPAQLMLARLRAAEGDTAGALAQIETVLAAQPGDENAALLKGDLLLRVQREPDAALAVFRQALQAHPASVPARVAVVNILLQKQDTTAARAEIELLKKAAPRHPETLFFEAQLAFADKNFKHARELTDLVLKMLPDQVRVLELAGAAEFRMGGYAQAEAFLAKAVKLAPRQLQTRHMLAQTYLRSGQATKALELLQPVVDGGSPDATTLSLLGESYLQAGDARHSEEAFQRALKLAPQDNRVRTTAAEALMARGENVAAAAELEAIAAGDAGPRADLALVSARLRQGDTAAALKAIDGLEKKMPDQPLPHHLRGRVLTLRHDEDGAARAYLAAIAKDSTYFPAVAALAALDMAAGKPDDARRRFSAHLKAYPKSWQAKLGLAELDARTGAPSATVLATLREAVKLGPAEPRTHVVLINNLLASGDARAALQAAQDATAVLPDNAEIVEAQGRAELGVGDTQRAISSFKKLATMQPRSAGPEMRLAEAYLATKDRDAALRSLRRALEIQPGAVAPQRALAQMALQDNRPQDALAIARSMQKAKPKEADGYVLEGDIEMTRKAWEPALAAYRAANQRATPSTELTVKLHGSLLRAAKTAEADALAASWLKGHPRDAAFEYYLGDQALAHNDLQRAEARYRTVLELVPEHALAMNNVAWLMARQGKPGALPLAEKANQLMPNRAPLLDTLATVLEAENQIAKAIDTQKRAITIDPKDPRMNLRLAKLYIKSGDKAGARAELETLAKLGDKFPSQAEVASLLKTL